jgi:hypothetical protein
MKYQSQHFSHVENELKFFLPDINQLNFILKKKALKKGSRGQDFSQKEDN